MIEQHALNATRIGTARLWIGPEILERRIWVMSVAALQLHAPSQRLRGTKS
jgi:hypothetical protein